MERQAGEAAFLSPLHRNIDRKREGERTREVADKTCVDTNARECEAGSAKFNICCSDVGNLSSLSVFRAQHAARCAATDQQGQFNLRQPGQQPIMPTDY